MKIGKRKDDRNRTSGVRNDIDVILRSGSDIEPVCAPNCPNAGPNCSRHCSDIPRMASSDPDKHPLETLIAPLVFELKRLKAFIPCWSCEGHCAPDGTLWKIPRVWFYCDSVVHLRLLDSALKELNLAQRLNVPWRVALTFSEENNVDTTFSLEPALDGELPALTALQRDVDTIAEQLRDEVFKEARKLSRWAQ